MSYLTARAEQALIGALLAEQPLPGEFAHLRADDFAHRVLRKAYTAILDLRDQVPSRQLPDAVAARLAMPGVDADWLRQLRDACPAPAHIAAYARMVQVAAFRRDIAREGERIAATARTDRATDPATAGVSRLADALARQTHVFEAFTSIDEHHATPIHTVAAAQPRPTGAEADRTDRAYREDQLLADLLANPQQAVDVARIVPPDTFTSEQRREIFMTIVTLAAEREPIDEVIVLWEFERLRAVADLYGGGDLTYRGDETSPEPTAAYLARLSTTTIVAGTAVTIGHQLVVDDVRQQLTRTATAAGQWPAIDAHPARQDQDDPRLHPDPTQQPPASTTPNHQPKIDR